MAKSDPEVEDSPAAKKKGLVAKSNPEVEDSLVARKIDIDSSPGAKERPCGQKQP